MAEAQLSPSAVEDIEAHLEYLRGVDAPESAAHKFLENVRRVRAWVGQQPNIGVDRPEWGSPPALQSLSHDRHVYVFTSDPSPPLIVRVLGPGTDPNATFGL